MSEIVFLSSKSRQRVESRKDMKKIGAALPNTLVRIGDTEFSDSEYRESPADATRELQLVLDPEFL
jgi:hypothetical protein